MSAIESPKSNSTSNKITALSATINAHNVIMTFYRGLKFWNLDIWLCVILDVYTPFIHKIHHLSQRQDNLYCHKKRAYNHTDSTVPPVANQAADFVVTV